jgi:hypothetical protein
VRHGPAGLLGLAGFLVAGGGHLYTWLSRKRNAPHPIAIAYAWLSSSPRKQGEVKSEEAHPMPMNGTGKSNSFHTIRECSQ